MSHRVLIVDDAAFMRSMIAEILEKSGEFEVVGYAATSIGGEGPETAGR